MKNVEKRVTYHKKYKVDKASTIIKLGGSNDTGDFNDDGQELIEINNAIDEFTFYFAYLTINNITMPENNILTKGQRMVLCALMVKSLDFTLPMDSKDNKLAKVAEDLSSEDDIKTPNSIYQTIKKLKSKGYLLYTEDKLVVVCAKLQRMRSLVKTQLNKEGIATFDYLFKSYIKPYETEEDKESDSDGTTIQG